MMVHRKAYAPPIIDKVAFHDVIALSGNYIIVEPISDGGTYIN